MAGPSLITCHSDLLRSDLSSYLGDQVSQPDISTKEAAETFGVAPFIRKLNPDYDLVQDLSLVGIVDNRRGQFTGLVNSSQISRLHLISRPTPGKYISGLPIYAGLSTESQRNWSLYLPNQIRSYTNEPLTLLSFLTTEDDLIMRIFGSMRTRLNIAGFPRPNDHPDQINTQSAGQARYCIAKHAANSMKVVNFRRGR